LTFGIVSWSHPGGPTIYRLQLEAITASGKCRDNCQMYSNGMGIEIRNGNVKCEMRNEGMGKCMEIGKMLNK